VRDGTTGRLKGTAFVEFAAVAAVGAAMQKVADS
jgi:hypothetical protein